MIHAVSSATATRLALLIQVEELRAELAAVSCPVERRMIERDLRTALAQVRQPRRGP